MKIFILVMFALFTINTANATCKYFAEDNSLLYCKEIDNVEICKDKNLSLYSGMVYCKDENESILKESLYKNGKKEGLSQSFYPSGKLETKANYKNGKLNGYLRSYYENGLLRLDAHYKDGRFNGLIKEYYKNGQLEREMVMKNGIWDGFVRVYYPNGALASEENYKDGSLNGLYVKYYSFGGLSKIGYYKEGKFSGLNMIYHSIPNFYDEVFSPAMPQIIENYKNDKLDGVQKNFSENGELKIEEYYKDGKRQSSKFFSYILIEADYKNGSINEVQKIYIDHEQIDLKKAHVTDAKEILKWFCIEENHTKDKQSGIYKSYYIVASEGEYQYITEIDEYQNRIAGWECRYPR